MFCPLCNAEYRDGFTQGSDCKLALVHSIEEARSQNVSVWKGDSERKLDTVLDALSAESIPYHYREGLSPVPKLVFSRVPVRPRFDTEVWVLQKDFVRAEAAIRNLDRDPDPDDDESDDEASAATAMRFCPLCQSEYGPGFSECSDCHVPLVGSRIEAQRSAPLARKGSSQTELDDVVRALDQAEIPSHHKDLLNPRLRLNIAGFDLIPKKPTFEYEVWVFRSDAERAKAAIAALTRG